MSGGLTGEAAGVYPPSRSRKKASQIGHRSVRRDRKSKPANWMDVATRLKKYKARRRKQLEREVSSRRRNGCKKRPQR